MAVDVYIAGIIFAGFIRRNLSKFFYGTPALLSRKKKKFYNTELLEGRKSSTSAQARSTSSI